MSILPWRLLYGPRHTQTLMLPLLMTRFSTIYSVWPQSLPAYRPRMLRHAVSDLDAEVFHHVRKSWNDGDEMNRTCPCVSAARDRWGDCGAGWFALAEFTNDVTYPTLTAPYRRKPTPDYYGRDADAGGDHGSRSASMAADSPHALLCQVDGHDL